MIAGQVGEGGGGDRDAVEPVLREPVARRLDRRHARRRCAASSARSRCSATGSGVVSAPGRRPAGDTRPSVPRLAAGWPSAGPDLAGEMRDRGLAVGAGDRGDRPRLPRDRSAPPAGRGGAAGWGRRRSRRGGALSASSAERGRRRRSGSRRRPSRPPRRQRRGRRAGVPRNAANRKPGWTWRESAVSPVISGSASGAAPAADGPGGGVRAASAQ